MALKTQPGHAASLYANGLLYQSCSMLPEALQSMRLALKAAPDDEQTKDALANALTDHGMQRHSISCFKMLQSLQI